MASTVTEPDMPSEVAPLLARAQVAPKHVTILLVEDEEFVGHVTSEVLAFAGYRMLCARHAAEAMRIFRQYEEDVQLLLTDVVLPGRNGHDLARDLRIVRPALKIMFISGYPEDAATKCGSQEPGVIHLPKPFSVESLMRTVEQILAEDGIAEKSKAKSAARK